MSSTYADRPFDAMAQADRMRRVQRIARIARLMDTAVHVPFVGVRFGLDSVIGLVPGIGDAAGGLVGLYIINEARKLGMPKQKLLKMVANVALDAAVGSVPVAGDVFDVYFKSHRRNAQMVLDHFGDSGSRIDPDSMKDITPKR
ncbi:DUF4112 domain-containing protein [Aureimonas leprariae]|uniref:DUF4112 domain-containing protein n=1 Tax=Plantimonas leprariae TaxID=2615207 RepID=A0A7V7PQX0_9HYPH|nr:DUF4112 domain-containing protein [Aureimonas leprariae]KAB0680810.1 DUF4112 domain-containing protein [Aureimonas leprariae]